MKKMFDLLQKAQTSTLSLWFLNRVMNHAVPFNKPHGFRAVKITDDAVQVFAPHHKKNFNHLRGIHACALATAGELAAGLVLMRHFSPKEYRFIMSHIEIDYHYQAKKDITATAALSETEKENILKKLSTENKTVQTITTDIKDKDSSAIATVKTSWQIKKWADVRTQL
ncbi:MAG: YiiD C-terminal domain-containing protein [Gammaproteobacteria bacterium]|nr:YiiD C-terminal domain-containing protein [Gammaproteobacteria bacterium]